MLAFISLAEQTALNSVSPYLPEMASTFPSVNPSRVGLDVGTIASAFALAQLVTGFFWGWLSDRVGRKPVIVFGTLLTAGCFMAFGFCKTLWQAILVQALMGLTNGNQAVVPTCLGEITDRSNQSRAFMWLPVVYGVGAISGPITGGLLVAAPRPDGTPSVRYPYLLPNLISAAILLIDALVTIFYLDETLEHVRNLPPLSQRLRILFTWCWRTCSVKASRILHVDLPGAHRHHHNRRRPSLVADSDEVDAEDVMSNASTQDSLAAMPALFPHQRAEIDSKDVLNKDTVLLLVSYLIFQLCNVAYMSLYPIFASSLPPTGRGLSPGVIGISLAFAGVVTILFQLGIFGRFRDALGNRGTYRVAFAGFTVAFFAMPFVGYKDTYHGATTMWQRGTVFMWAELGIILLIKTIATIGGLTSVLLMVIMDPVLSSIPSPDHLCRVAPMWLRSRSILDYQLGTQPQRAGDAQRTGTDAGCRRPCYRAVRQRCALLHRHQHQTQGRTACLGCLWRCGLHRVSHQLGRQEPGARGRARR